MGWLEGLLTGYMDRHYAIQKEEMDEAKLAADRQAQVFQTLLNSEYADIKDYAAAGILDLANPRRRKGGIAGWMGEVEQTPYLGAIRRARQRIEWDPEYAQQNRVTRPSIFPGQPSVPSPGGAIPTPAPAAGAAAQPATSVTTGGAQPTPVQPSPQSQPPAPGLAGPQFPSARAQRGFGDVYGQPAPIVAAPPRPPFVGPQAQPTGLPAAQNYSLAPVGAGGPPQSVVAGVAGVQPQPPQPQAQPQAQAAVAPQALVPVTAGPALPVSAAAPPPPGLAYAQGQPGGTTAPVGRMPPTAARRTTLQGLPSAFPSSEDMVMRATRVKAQADAAGEIEVYKEMFQRASPTPLSDQAAYQQAAEFYMATKMRNQTESVYSGPIVPDASSPTGYMQLILDRQDASIRNRIPVPAPGTTSSRAPNQYEMVAHAFYGDQPQFQGKDPKTVYAEVTRGPGGALASQNIMRRAQIFAAGKPMTTSERFSAAERLRDDWSTYAKNYQTQRAALVQMRAARQTADADRNMVPTSAEQIIVLFEKMLDPNSVVRETEARRPGSMQPFLESLQGLVSKFRGPGGPGNITWEGITRLVDASEATFAAIEQQVAAEAQKLQQYADSYDLGPLGLTGATPLGAPPNPNAPQIQSQVGASVPNPGTTQTPKPATTPGTVTLDAPIVYNPVTKKMELKK